MSRTKVFYLLYVFFLSVVIVIGCGKDMPKPAEEEYNPTAHEVEIPDFVSLYLGDMPETPDNPLTEEGIALGRKLFYDTRLSDDMSMSCATCHKQEFSFDDSRQFSRGTNGSFGDRNAMPVINLAWGKDFFWDGRRQSLEGQAHDPVTNPIEMNNQWPIVVERLQQDTAYHRLFFKAFGTRTIDSNLVVKAIAQFERTMVSFNSRFDDYYFREDTTALNEQEKRGLFLYFNTGRCNDCHSGVLLTDGQFKNNGLDLAPGDAGYQKFTGHSYDLGKFKVPTLRNIEKTAPYMHDGRFETLDDVINFYSTQVQKNSPNIDEHMKIFGNGLLLTQEQKEDLKAFLLALTDQQFIQNPKFSNPH